MGPRSRRAPLRDLPRVPPRNDPGEIRPAFRTRFSTRLALTLQGVPYPFGAHRRGGLPPVVVPRPPAGGYPRGKPVRAFLGAHRRRLRAPRGVRGPAARPFPVVLARSPPLASAWRPPRRDFRRRLGRLPSVRGRVLHPPHPWLRPAPPGGLRTGREVPALGRRKPGQRPVARFPPLPVG